MSVESYYQILLLELRQRIVEYYGDRLTSLVVYGSVGRGSPNSQSDLDFLIVATDLPHGRIKRMAEFNQIEKLLFMQPALLRSDGSPMDFSPVFKTPDEVRHGSLLFLDFIDDAQFLFDRDDFFKNFLAQFQHRLNALGARRIWQGNAWYWDLKPNFKSGEVFEL